MKLLRRGRVRHLLIWLVIVASCVYASSSSMLRMLGAPHWHAAPQAAAAAPATAGWDHAAVAQLVHWLADICGLAEAMHQRAHALGLVPHQHHHSALLRHWHADDDSTVRLAADAAVAPELADLSAAAAIGSATLLLALGPDCAWRGAGLANGAWPAAARQAWRSVRLPPPTEPPIA